MSANYFNVRFVGAILLLGASMTTLVRGQVNSWSNPQSGTWNWATASNWQLGLAPSSGQSLFITNAASGPSGSRFRVVTVDSTTASQPSTMTVNSLTLAGTGSGLGASHNTLFLNNAGLATPLYVLNALTNTTGGIINIVNSALIVDGPLIDDASIQMTSATLMATPYSTAIGLNHSASFVATNSTLTCALLYVGDASVGAVSTLTILDSTFIGQLSVDDGTMSMSDGELITDLGVSVGGGGGSAQMTLSNVAWQSSDAVDVVGSIGGEGTLTVLDGTSTLDSLWIALGSATVTGTVWLSGGQMSITGDETFVANDGVGQLNVSNATLFVSFIDMGLGSNSVGTVTIAGGTVTTSGIAAGDIPGSTGTVWLLNGSFDVNGSTIMGYAGSGLMIISNGTYSGQGMELGYVGYLTYPSCGTLTVAGGTNSLSSHMDLGAIAGSTGSVWITGGQLTVANSDTIVGSNGVGRVTVSNGTWRARNVLIAPNDGAEGTLTAVGGTSSVYSNVTIGDCESGGVGLLVVKGGDVFITNATHDAVLDVRNGFVVLTAGQLTVDRLVMTNECGVFFHGGGSLSVGSMLLDPDLDADDDGLPNGWEQAHGLDPLSSLGGNGADGDPDGDGLSNLEEYQLGTDPLDSSSPYHITAIQRQGNDVSITWMTVNGKTNVLQSAPGTLSGSYSNNFTDLSPKIITPGCFCVATTNYLDVGGMLNFPSRYYRVRVLP
jgi:hypothetical protein